MIKFILLATMSAMTPKGLVQVPMSLDFATRAECVAYLDTSLQAMRQVHPRGPLTLTLISYCEAKR